MAGNAITGREPLSNRFTPRLYTLSGVRAGGLACCPRGTHQLL